MSGHVYDPGPSGWCSVCEEHGDYCTGARAPAARRDHSPRTRQQNEPPEMAPLPSGPGDPGTGPPDPRMAIENRKNMLRVDGAARDELAAELAPPIPASFSGAVFLAQPDNAPAYRIAQLWPMGGNVVLAAQFKAGKTTLRDNLIRCLADGMPFLGRYPVTAFPGRVFVLDCEMPERTARRWLNAHMITNADRFEYCNLRGATAAFNILVPQIRAAWAKKLAEAETAILVLDCIGPILAALGLEENKASDTGRFLAALDQLVSEAGVPESFVIHHMGHDAERSRGASRLRDWPDAEWRLVRRDDNPASPRYLSAFGRDVNVEESRLGYDDQTRGLAIGDGSRRTDQAGAARAALAELLGREPDLSGSAIEKKLGDDHARQAIRDAVKDAVKDRQVLTKNGPRNATVHYLNPQFADLAGPRHKITGEVGSTSPVTVGNGEVKHTPDEAPTSPPETANSRPAEPNGASA